MELVTAPVQAAVGEGEGTAPTIPSEQQSSTKRPQNFSPRRKVKLARSGAERETADDCNTLTEQSKARSGNCLGCAAQIQGHECQDDEASPGPRVLPEPPLVSSFPQGARVVQSLQYLKSRLVRYQDVVWVAKYRVVKCTVARC